MSWISVLRDGENLSEGMSQREIAYAISDCPVVPGVGTGYSAGLVGKMNGAAGANPNHFSVQANGSNLVLTIQPGYCWIVKDSGSVTYDPRVVYLVNNAAISLTLVGNSQGTSRTDTICVRFDQTIAPDSIGSNLPTIVQVQGGASNAVGNAPSDGALYLPLANVVIANNAVNVAQGNVTDRRQVQPSQAIVSVFSSAGAVNLVASTFTAPSLDAPGVVTDKAGMFTTAGQTSTLSAAARYTCPLPGRYITTARWEATAAAVSVEAICSIMKNAGEHKRGSRIVTGPGGGSPCNGVVSTTVQCAYGDTIGMLMFAGNTSVPAVGQSSVYFDAEWTGF
jgi:hypothetical protein